MSPRRTALLDQARNDLAMAEPAAIATARPVPAFADQDPAGSPPL